MDVTRICSVEGCGKPQLTRKGWCSAHHQRFRKYGSPTGGPRGPRAADGEPLAWILSHLDYDGADCLIWPFARFLNGYASILYRGTSSNASKAMCHEKHGEPPEGKPFALHSCANGHSGCVHPMHVRWGSQAENMADSVADGTRSRGSANNASKLTEDDVREIRRLIGTMQKKQIGAMFGINGDHVRAIERGLVWGWLK